MIRGRGLDGRSGPTLSWDGRPSMPSAWPPNIEGHERRGGERASLSDAEWSVERPEPQAEGICNSDNVAKHETSEHRSW